MANRDVVGVAAFKARKDSKDSKDSKVSQSTVFKGLKAFKVLRGFRDFRDFKQRKERLDCREIKGGQGSLGSQGSQGSLGSQGLIGAQGVQGVQGLSGLQGGEGNQGFDGFQGLQGYQGYQVDVGIQGVEGSQGGIGFQGVQGVEGVQGFQGYQGGEGVQGVQGLDDLFINLTAFVDARYGNDATAQLDNEARPFLTIDAANVAATAAGTPSAPYTVYVQPGNYVAPEGGFILSSNVHWYFTEGTYVNNALDSPIFVQVAPDVVTTISGYANFYALNGTALGLGGVLHLLGDNGAITFTGEEIQSTAGPAFFIGAGVTSNTGYLLGDIVRMTTVNFAGIQSGGASNIAFESQLIIATDASILWLTETAGAVVGATTATFVSLNSEIMIGRGTDEDAAPLGLIVDAAELTTSMNVRTHILDARTTFAPAIALFGTVTSLGTQNLVEASIIAVGNVLTAVSGGIILGESTGGGGPNLVVESGNIFSLGGTASAIILFNTQARVTATTAVFFHTGFAGLFGYPISVHNNSLLALEVVQFQAVNGGIGVLTPMFGVNTGGRLIVHASEVISVESTLVQADLGANTVSFEAISININVNNNGQLLEPAIFIPNAQIAGFICAQIRVNVVSTVGQAASYALIFLSAFANTCEISNLTVTFPPGFVTTPLNAVTVLQLGDGTTSTQSTVEIGYMIYNGDRTIGVALMAASELTGSLRNITGQSDETIVVTTAGTFGLVSSAITLSSVLGSSATSRAFQVTGGIPRLIGCAIVVTDGSATAVDIQDNLLNPVDVFLYATQISSILGRAIDINLTLTGSDTRVSITCQQIQTLGSFPVPVTTERCISLESTAANQCQVQFLFENVNTGSCSRGMQMTSGPLATIVLFMRANRFFCNPNLVDGVEVGIGWVSGDFSICSLNIDELIGRNIAPPPTSLVSAVVSQNGGRMYLRALRMENLFPFATALNEYAPTIRIEINSLWFQGHVDAAEQIGRCAFFNTSAVGTAYLQVGQAITYGGGVTIDAVIYLAGSGEYTYHGLLRNLSPVQLPPTIAQSAVTIDPLATPVRIRMRASTLVAGEVSIFSTAAQTVIMEPSSTNLAASGTITFAPAAILFVDPLVQ